jgi:hypothetical protein
VTVRMVKEIRHAYAGGRSQSKLAAEHGVSKSTVARIVRGEAHPELGGPTITKPNTQMRECWRGHDMATNRRPDGLCRGCHTIRNRHYRRRRRAEDKKVTSL